MSIFTIASLVVGTAITLSPGTAGKSHKLQWQTNYGAAKTAAQSSQRPLVVVLENPGRLQRLDDSQLGSKNKQTLQKQQFELVRINVGTNYGRRVAEAFGATRFPYTAVTDQISKRIVFRKSGPMHEQDWTLAIAKSLNTTRKNRVQATPVSSSASTSVAAQSARTSVTKSIVWSENFDAGMQEAKEQNRPVFLFLTTSGCVYCEKMKREAFPKRSVIQAINSAFVPIQVNGGRNRGQSMADR